MLLSGHCSSDRWTWWAASRTSRQIRFRALRRSHYGSGPSRGGPGGIIAVPLSLTVYIPSHTLELPPFAAWPAFPISGCHEDAVPRPALLAAGRPIPALVPGLTCKCGLIIMLGSRT